LAQLALLLTVAFIVYALRLDLRQGQRFSGGMWISFAWIAIIASRPVIYWVHPRLFVGFSQRIAWEQQHSIEIIQGDSLDRNIVFILMALGLIALMGRRGRFRLKLADNGWLIAFFAYCLVSIVWADYPGVIFKKWIRFIGDATMILLILTESQAGEKVYRIMRRMAILFLPLSALLAKFYPEMGRIYTVYGTQMWVGVAGHKNSLGFLCAFMGIVLVWRNLEKWPKVDLLDVGLLALTAYLLRGAKSTTSIIVFLLGTALLIAQSLMKWDFRKLNRAIIIGLCVLLVVQVLAVSFIGRSIAPGVFAAAGKDASLTGRIPLWRELIQMGSRTAVLGSGFASFWLNPARLSELWSRVNWTPTTAHNGYIEVFLDLGIIGLLILFFLLVQTFKNIIRSFDGDPEFSKLKAVLFMMIFFHNFSESSYGKPSALLWLLFLLVSIVIRAKPGEEADLAPQPWA
jgi:O-antigen ligase